MNDCFHINQNLSQPIDNVVFRGRVLWRDITTWLGAYLISMKLSSGFELQIDIADKLLFVPVEYGNMIRLFFGDQAAAEYTTLVSNYITLMINLIHAQMNGDIAAANEYITQLNQNIEERAEFLSKTNPFWQKNALQSLNYNYTNMTIQQINAFLAGQYKESTNTFGRIMAHTSSMGDYVGQGIINYLTYGAGPHKKFHYE